MSGVQAEIILSQLGRIGADSAARIAKAKLYAEGLRGVRGVILPPMRTDGSHIYLYYPALFDDRDGLAQDMTRRLRDVQISHHRNCAALPCFREYAADCPNAERAANSVLYLPVYPSYSDDEVRENITAIRAYAGGANT
jgi:dTDP-4-amino-4,6-dideoxygalactose transaminase